MMSFFGDGRQRHLNIHAQKLHKNAAIYINKQLRQNHIIKEFMYLNYDILFKLYNSLDFNC